MTQPITIVRNKNAYQLGATPLLVSFLYIERPAKPPATTTSRRASAADPQHSAADQKCSLNETRAYTRTKSSQGTNRHSISEQMSILCRCPRAR